MHLFRLTGRLISIALAMVADGRARIGQTLYVPMPGGDLGLVYQETERGLASEIIDLEQPVLRAGTFIEEVVHQFILNRYTIVRQALEVRYDVLAVNGAAGLLGIPVDVDWCSIDRFTTDRLDRGSVFCDRYQFIVLDELECLLQRVPYGWRQHKVLISPGSTNIRQLFRLRRIDDEVVAATVYADNHAFVNFVPRTHKHFGPLL